MLKWIKRELWPTIRAMVSQWRETEGHVLAASLAYYAIFSLFPLLMVLISVMGFLLRFSSPVQQRRADLLQVISENISPQLAEQVAELLDEVRLNAGFSGPVGLVTLLFGALGIFYQLQLAFERIWSSGSEEHGKKSLKLRIWNIIHGRLRAFLMMLSMGLVMAAAFILSLVLHGIRKHAPGMPGDQYLWQLVSMAVGVGFNCLFFTVAYKALSIRAVRWIHACAGGLLAALAWEVGRQLLAMFVIGDRYTAYGIVGSFIAILLWIYYASTILLLGGVFVHVLHHRSSVGEFSQRLANATDAKPTSS